MFFHLSHFKLLSCQFREDTTTFKVHSPCYSKYIDLFTFGFIQLWSGHPKYPKYRVWFDPTLMSAAWKWCCNAVIICNTLSQDYWLVCDCFLVPHIVQVQAEFLTYDFITLLQWHLSCYLNSRLINSNVFLLIRKSGFFERHQVKESFT